MINESHKPFIYLGADHGGYELKEQAKEWLSAWGYDFQDVGAHQLDADDDYPQFAFSVAEKVAQDDQAVGVLLCRSGGGVTIASNKVAGIRAVAVNSAKEATHAKIHNNANVIAISGDWVSEDEAEDILRTFLTTEFTNEERHLRRINQINQYEKKL